MNLLTIDHIIILTIDHIIVYAFLIITLAVGIYYGRGVKTLRNFAIANRSYGAPMIAVTLIATMIGAGSVIVDLIETIDSNFIYILSLLGLIAGIIIFAIFFAPKFDTRFKDCISMGDILNKSLSKVENKIACFAMFLNCAAMLSNQLIVMGYICKNFLGLPYETSVVVTSSIIIIYSSFGGIRAVTVTDLLQFFMLIIAIPLIAMLFLSKAQINSYDVTVYLQPMFFDKRKIIDYFALAGFWIIPLHLLQAHIVQRYLMTKSTTLKLSIITLGYALMKVLMLLIFVVIAICFLKLEPLSDSSEVISIVIQKYLQFGVKGLALCGIIAVIMSTADSLLNTSSVLFIKNILPESISQNENKGLFLTKITTIIIGVSASLIALQNLKPVTLMVYADTLLIAGASIPLMAGLFGFKVNRATFWIGLVTAGLTYTISKHNLPEFKYIHSLFTLIASLAAFFISHYIINKGFAFDPNMKVVKQPKRKVDSILPSF